MTLLVDVNSPASPEILVSNWKPVCSLVWGAIARADIALFWLWLPRICLPACSREWAGLQTASFTLVFTQSFVL